MTLSPDQVQRLRGEHQIKPSTTTARRGWAKATPQDIVAAASLMPWMTQVQLAKELGVSQSRISKVLAQARQEGQL